MAIDVSQAGNNAALSGLLTGDSLLVVRPGAPGPSTIRPPILLADYATLEDLDAVNAKVAPIAAEIPNVVADGQTDNHAVLQAFLTAAAATGAGVACRLPAGKIVCLGTLAVTLADNAALAIQGAGQDITELLFTAQNADGLVVTYDSSADYRRDISTGAKFQLRDLSIVHAHGGTTNDGVRVVGDSQNAAGINMPATMVHNVVFRGTSNNGGWANHLVYQDVANTSSRDIRMAAPNANNVLVSSGSGIVIRTSPNVYGTLHVLDNVAAVGLNRCVDIGERVQGVEVVNCNFIGGRGIYWNSNGRQEQLSVANSEFSCIDAGIDCFNLQNIMVASSVFYSQRAYPINVGTPGAYTAINLAEVDTSQITGNSFQGAYLDGEFGIVITNDTALVSTGRTTGGPHSVPMMPPGTVICGNTFTNFYGQALFLKNNTSNILVVGNCFDNIAGSPPITVSAGTSAQCSSNSFAGHLFGVGFPGSAGFTMDVTSADTINAALGPKVQNGTGVGQNPNNVLKLGWDSTHAKPRLTVDLTDEGNVALESWVTGLLAANPSVQNGSGVGQNANNLLKFGWDSNVAKPRLTVDLTDKGYVALETWVLSEFVQMGTGIGQSPASVLKFGWDVTHAKPKLTVDLTDLGNVALEAWVLAQIQATVGVQNGTGVGQNPLNILKLGWDSDHAKPKLTVDLTDEGNVALESWVLAQFAANPSVQNGSGVGQNPGSVLKFGWDSTHAKPRLTVDLTDVGNVALETWVTAQLAGLSTGGSAGPVTVQAISPGATVTLAFGTGRETVYALTLTQNCTVTINGVSAGTDQLMTVDIIQGGSGGFVPTINGVSWAGGIAPAFNTALTKRDTIQVRASGSDVSAYPVSMGRVPMIAAVPVAPAAPTVTPGVNSNSINVAAVSAYPVVTGYTIYRGTAAGAENATPIATNVALPYVDTGLTPGVPEFYKVSAVNAVGTGPNSPEASGTPLSAGSAPSAPGAPSLTAGDGQIVLTGPTVTASPAVTGYTIFRGTAAGAESGTAIATNVALPYADTGRTNGTPYFYKFAAVNSVGTGAQSPEASATPVAAPAGNSAHYATFSALNQAIYASPNPIFNPGANSFDLRAKINMANYVPGGTYEQNLWGVWDGVTPASRIWRLGITTDGRIRASWATSATVFPTATSAAVISATGGNDLWVRAVVTPTTGAVAFYTSTDGSVWTALGATQTAGGTGAVYTPASPPYMVIGQDASGGSAATQEQFIGRMIECRFYNAGTLVTNPVMGPSATTDVLGVAYSTSSGVVYT